jgi:hypothetical protein
MWNMALMQQSRPDCTVGYAVKWVGGVGIDLTVWDVIKPKSVLVVVNRWVSLKKLNHM